MGSRPGQKFPADLCPGQGLREAVTVAPAKDPEDSVPVADGKDSVPIHGGKHTRPAIGSAQDAPCRMPSQVRPCYAAMAPGSSQRHMDLIGGHQGSAVEVRRVNPLRARRVPWDLPFHQGLDGGTLACEALDVTSVDAQPTHLPPQPSG